MRTSRRKGTSVKSAAGFFITALFLLTSCSTQKVEQEKKSGAVNQVEAGKPFHINLPEDHKTLYLWSINNGFDDQVVHYMGSSFRSNEKGVDFNFEAAKPGKTEISFSLRSYNDTSEVRTFVIEVK